MQKKSQAFIRYMQDIADNKFSYYESDEIEDIAYDLIGDGNMEDAHVVVDKGLSLHPGNENLELLKIWILMHTHHMKEAESLFAKYKEQDSDVVLRLKFEFEVFKGHTHEALSQFLPLLKKGEIQPLDWLQTINEMFDYFNPGDLAPYLVMAMDMMPENVETWGQLGGLLMDLQEFQQAIIALEHSLDIDPYNVYSWQDLSRCYYLIGNDKKCAEASEYGLAVDPKNPMLSFTRSFVYFNQREYKKAIPLLEITRQYHEGKLSTDFFMGPEEDQQEQANITYNMLAHCYRETDQVDKALECLKTHFERNPKNVESALNLSSNHLEIGDLPSALEIINNGLAFHPKESTLLALKVTILTSLHKFEEANETLNNLIALKPRSYAYRLAKAQLCISTGKEEEGDKTFRELLALNPKERATRQMLIEYFTSIGDKEALDKLNSRT